MNLNLKELTKKLEKAKGLEIKGYLTSLIGLSLKAKIAGVEVGELVEIKRNNMEPLIAEITGFVEEEVTLVPFGECIGISPGTEVIPKGEPFSILCGEALLGRIVDGLGNPIDGRPLPKFRMEPWQVFRNPPSPLQRTPIREPITLGIKAIDMLTTVGKGQRIGLFAGSGVGKSTLLGQIARGTNADIVVVCLIGERGREVREFLEESLGEEGLKRSVVVVATSDTPAMVRLKSAEVATAIAEYFRDKGMDVLLMMDSLTRFARAAREIGLASGEPPTRRGYPPSVFARLPKLLERGGTSSKGTITAIYTVLVEGGDMEEPIADEVRGILDGHIILSRELGQRGQWPAIDVLSSLSRVMDRLVTEEHKASAQRLRTLLATYENQRDMILLGAYKKGTDPKVDEAIAYYPKILSFLKQDKNSLYSFEESLRLLLESVR